jgi:hypothetical protein
VRHCRIRANGKADGDDAPFVPTENNRKISAPGVSVSAVKSMIGRLKRAKRTQDSRAAQQQTGDGYAHNNLPRDVANLIHIILTAEADRDQKREEQKARPAKKVAAAQAATLAGARGEAMPLPLADVLYARPGVADARATASAVAGNSATGLADHAFSPVSVGDPGRRPGSRGSLSSEHAAEAGPSSRRASAFTPGSGDAEAVVWTAPLAKRSKSSRPSSRATPTQLTSEPGGIAAVVEAAMAAFNAQTNAPNPFRARELAIKEEELQLQRSQLQLMEQQLQRAARQDEERERRAAEERADRERCAAEERAAQDRRDEERRQAEANAHRERLEERALFFQLMRSALKGTAG